MVNRHFRYFFILLLCGINSYAMEDKPWETPTSKLIISTMGTSNPHEQLLAKGTPIPAVSQEKKSNCLETSDGHFLFIPKMCTKQCDLFETMLKYSDTKTLTSGKLDYTASNIISTLRLLKNGLYTKETVPAVLQIAHYLGAKKEKIMPVACAYLDTIPYHEQDETLRSIA